MSVSDITRMRVHADTIDRYDWETVFRIWQDGTPEVMPDEYAPSIMCEGGDVIHLESGWFTVSEGYTHQDGYRGPILADNEHFSRGMLEGIMEQYDYRTHYFAQIPATYEDGEVEGWVVVAKKVTV